MKIIFIIFLAISTLSYANDNSKEGLIISSLMRIEDKIDGVRAEVSIVREIAAKNDSRIARLESWKEQMTINTARFYTKDWDSTKNELKEIQSAIRSLEDNFSRIQGVVLAFMVFGSLLSFLINIFITGYVSRRRLGDILKEEN